MHWHVQLSEVLDVHPLTVFLALLQVGKGFFIDFRGCSGESKPILLNCTHDHGPLAEISLVYALDQYVEDLLHSKVAEKLVAIVKTC